MICANIPSDQSGKHWSTVPFLKLTVVYSIMPQKLDEKRLDELHKTYGGRKFIIGVDKDDPSSLKELVECLDSYDPPEVYIVVPEDWMWRRNLGVAYPFFDDLEDHLKEKDIIMKVVFDWFFLRNPDKESIYHEVSISNRLNSGKGWYDTIEDAKMLRKGEFNRRGFDLGEKNMELESRSAEVNAQKEHIWGKALKALPENEQHYLKGREYRGRLVRLYERINGGYAQKHKRKFTAALSNAMDSMPEEEREKLQDLKNQEEMINAEYREQAERYTVFEVEKNLFDYFVERLERVKHLSKKLKEAAPGKYTDGIIKAYEGLGKKRDTAIIDYIKLFIPEVVIAESSVGKRIAENYGRYTYVDGFIDPEKYPKPTKLTDAQQVKQSD